MLLKSYSFSNVFLYSKSEKSSYIYFYPDFPMKSSIKYHMIICIFKCPEYFPLYSSMSYVKLHFDFLLTKCSIHTFFTGTGTFCCRKWL